MAKRFRDTQISREGWYRRLPPVYKCVWNFICDECDPAGMWTIDTDAIEFNIGAEVEIERFMSAVNSDKVRVEKYGADKIFITGFVEFQYGELSEKCIPHRKIISLLKKYNLFHRVECTLPDRVQSTLKEEEEDKEEEKDKDEKGSGEKQKAARKPNFGKADTPTKKEGEAEYAGLIEIVRELPDIGARKTAIADFIATRKPKFIGPYADLWNLSVQRHSIAQLNGISEGRIKKFNTRIAEPLFDFIKILTEINRSDYLKGKTKDWKVDWDWIFENDTNYLKVIEGKYN